MKGLVKAFLYPIFIMMGTFVGAVLVVFGMAGFNYIMG